MYGQLEENGKIKNTCSIKIEDFEELPEGAMVGDVVKDGKAYAPPNGYSILSAVENSEPIWGEDADAKNVQIDALRRAAYSIESDPLFFKEQREEIEAGTWAAKVAEIKARFPKISA